VTQTEHNTTNYGDNYDDEDDDYDNNNSIVNNIISHSLKTSSSFSGLSSFKTLWFYTTKVKNSNNTCLQALFWWAKIYKNIICYIKQMRE